MSFQKKHRRPSKPRRQQRKQRMFESLEARQMMAADVWQAATMADNYSHEGEVVGTDIAIVHSTLGSTSDLRADGNRVIMSVLDRDVWQTNVGITVERPSVKLVNGVLEITGTDGDDVITMRQRDGLLTIDGLDQYFAVADVSRIEIDVKSGNDRVDLDSAAFDGQQPIVLDATIDGGDGVDALRGGDGDDAVYGGEGRDELHGGRGDDWIFGWIGDDVLFGGVGNDYLVAGAGDDQLNGDEGDDKLFGEAGADRLFGWVGNDVLEGGIGDDILAGGEGADGLNGDNGNDELHGEAGNDWLTGWHGNDVVAGGSGDDRLIGGAGDDLLRGADGNDQLYGEDGDDWIFGWIGNDMLFGGVGNDYLAGGSDDDQLHGDEGDDRLFGEAGADRLYGWFGNDVLEGGIGDDYLAGGEGADALNGDNGNDELHGEAGNDWLTGWHGNDVVAGGSGDDRLVGGDEDDVLRGADGNDQIHGEDGNDQLDGGEGRDEIHGGRGDDRLFGRAGDDRLRGEGGNDVLAGADGDDELDGGYGIDELDEPVLRMPGKLTFVEMWKKGYTTNSESHELAGLIDSHDVKFSPDGKNVYVGNSDGLWVLNRDLITGALTPLEYFETPLQFVGQTPGAIVIEGLGRVRGVSVSPDGKNVYTAGWQGNTLCVFHRDEATGRLTLVEVLQDQQSANKIAGATAVAGLKNTSCVTVSLDGNHIYATSESGAVVVFSRDPATGRLVHVETIRDGDTQGALTVDGLDFANQVMVSPDGRHVYVLGAGLVDKAIAVFDRDRTSGRLTFVGAYKDDDAEENPGSVDLGLSFPNAISASPDGEYLYVASFDALSIFRRDAETGELNIVEVLRDGDGGIVGLAGSHGVVVSPDGQHVYVTGEDDGALIVFDRDLETGLLTFAQILGDSISRAMHAPGLEQANRVAISPDGKNVYATSRQDTFTVFRRGIESLNQSPEAVEDLYTIDQGFSLTTSVRDGVLANDTEANGDAIKVMLVNGPFNGTLTLAADGSFSYVPRVDFHGIDTFSYRTSDGSSDSELATVRITVVPTDRPPVATISNAPQVAEGNEAVFTVTLDRRSVNPVKLTFETLDGTAKAGRDYLAQYGTLTIAPGETSGQIRVRTIDNTLDELYRSFAIRLTGAHGATISAASGIAFIDDNEPDPSISFDTATGRFNIAGNNQDDQVTVEYVLDVYPHLVRVKLETNRGPIVKSYNMEVVKEVSYIGRGGDDAFRNNTFVRAIVNGGDGNDKLWGGTGDDILVGGLGDDELAGGRGNDQLDGGGGFDIASFDSSRRVLWNRNEHFAISESNEKDTVLSVEHSLGAEDFEAQLALRWAPIHYQDVDPNGPFGTEGNSLWGRSDYITYVNFDGDWITSNNWENAKRYAQPACAYYSVVATDTHWYVLYAFYHPRDWSDTNPLDEHENDLEAVLTIVKRPSTLSTTDFGQLQGIVTTFHSDFYSFTPSGSPLRHGGEDIDGKGELMMEQFNGAYHPRTAQEAEGHGLKALGHVDVHGRGPNHEPDPTKDWVAYYPTLDTAEVPSSPYDHDVKYRLVNIFEAKGLWDQRHNQLTFTSSDSRAKFVGDNGIGAASAPWALDDTGPSIPIVGIPLGGDDGLPSGALAVDPARLADWYFDGEDFSRRYVSNPYDEGLSIPYGTAAHDEAVFFVNGFSGKTSEGWNPQNPNSLYSFAVQQGMTPHISNWNSVDQNGFAMSDDRFVQDMVATLETYDESDTVILVGYSFGGDSVLRVANATTTNIDALAVLDAVGPGGFRATAPDRVPSNVKYLYNRWEMLVGLLPPLDSPFVSGELQNDATKRLLTDVGIADQARIDIAHLQFPDNGTIQSELKTILAYLA